MTKEIYENAYDMYEDMDNIPSDEGIPFGKHKIFLAPSTEGKMCLIIDDDFTLVVDVDLKSVFRLRDKINEIVDKLAIF